MFMTKVKSMHSSKIVKLGSDKPVKVQMGEGSISPQVKLAAAKPVKVHMGEGSISPQVKLASAKTR
jgi:hypothetical protein